MLKDKGFYRGVNLGGWLSQCDYSQERLDTFITEADIEKIASWGLDHVRLPIDYNVVEIDEGTYKEDGFARIALAIEWCKKNHLNIVLDLHKTLGFSFDSGEKQSGFFDNEKLQERFCCLWEKFAKHFGNDPDHVAFELLNEVTAKEFIDTWNKVSAECIKRIRKYAPDTLILVGSYYNNSACAVKDLAPRYDTKVIYNFHCYDPLKFTHQGAYWTDAINPDERIAFDDADITPAFFDDFFASALEKAKHENSPLYCGEYGVIDVVSPEDTVKWYKAIHEIFEKYGISRSAWSYKQMDFGLSDERLDGVREELLKYL
ncbi:MAG: glycoside hydrolase family 5 protein [Lachnospiraceae bacterium]|nr:glycoside hydrolase family 5 protein [Lachnospiraceae bacterium]